jgi:hypothetical protein
MRQQTSQREPYLDAIDASFRTARDARAEDMDGERDHDSLVTWQARHRINESRAT